MKNLFSKLSLIAVLLAVFFTSCQKEDVSALTEGDKPSAARKADILAEPTFYNVIYNPDNGDVTVDQYLKRARKNLIPQLGSAGVLMKNLDSWANSKPSAVRPDALAFVSDINNPAYWPVRVNFNGKQCVVFRGGSSFVPRDPSTPTGTDGDYRINSANGLVRTEYGLSLELDYNKPYISGNGYKITYLPSSLKIIQRGVRPDHFEIVSTQEISVTQYKSLLSQIQSAAAQ
ncbi:hypothetical protein VB796_22260 [Arcicella sp. LKC2W]|uniref:hypothetical protein n=1 Tax=Arcicella sp. LKC2W TaxID=2984198 RepID=UPI002B21BCDE|nr:hypothetical protein [Arcicella sp. LKC2W]MEA5461810.1 hypothetical protein [Arcicella sp. LKC2W]